MPIIKSGLILLVLSLVVGCTITAPGVKVKAPLYGAEIELNTGHGGGNGFCPPGQAKKGNC